MLFQGHLLPARLILRLDLLDGFALDDDHALALRLIFRIIRHRLRKRRPECRLVFLRQLPADGRLSIPQRLVKLRESPQKVVRRLVKHNRARLILKLCKHPLVLLLVRRKKCLKTEPSRRKSRNNQRRNTRHRSRKRGYFNSRLAALAHQLLARIRNTRRPGVRDAGNIHARFQLLHQHTRLLDLIVLMVARHRCMNIKMIQKLNTVPRVLRRNQIHLL